MLSKLLTRISDRVSPFDSPEILYFDKIETKLERPTVRQIKIDTFGVPPTTQSYCLSKPKIKSLDVNINKVKSINLTYNTFSFVDVETVSIFEPIKKVATSGKSYAKSKDVEKPKQEILFSDIRCIHGLKEGSCTICREQRVKRDKRLKKEPTIDVFDLLYPILLPPLNLKNLTPLLPGKELRPYQIKGVQFLTKHESALLGDEMGLGKTVQSVMALKVLFHQGKITTCIIISPKAVLGSWITHLEDWAPELRVLSVRGQRILRKLKWSYPSHVYLTTYETLRQDIKNIDVEKFDICVLDEVQKVKNPSAKVTKSVRMLNAKIKWGLSGTPMENRVEELISVFYYLKPGLLKYEDAHYIKLVKERMKPYFLRRRKKDVEKDLPDKEQHPEWIELTPNQRASYDKAEQEGIVTLNELGDKKTIQHYFALITHLKQICNFEVESGESAKLDLLKEKLESIKEQGDKALVFSQFPNKTLKFLQPHLKKFKPLLYHGGLSDRQRENLLKKFIEEADNTVFLMSVRAAGLGINLQRANYVFHFDQWWNPATSAQAEDRTHRIGQKKTVFVTTIQTFNTIEERICQLLARKKALFQEVVDDLSDTDLRKVLTEDDLMELFGIKKGKNKKGRSELNSVNLKKLNPREFEETVEKIYSAMGYNVNITDFSRDEGIDLYAKSTTERGTDKLAIQCKHYPKGVVGVKAVRELYGVITHKQDISRGILVTSGRFSRDAREFVKNKRLELCDGVYISGLMEKYKIKV